MESPAYSTTSPFITLGGLLVIAFPIHYATTKIFEARSTPALPPFPPGPPRLPILGNLHQMSKPKTFLDFADWGRVYGSHSNGMIGLHLGPSAKMVVLNKWRQVRDLLDVRGAIYSDRPRNAVADLVTEGHNMALMSHGPVWRRQRRSLTAMFLRDADVDERLLPVQGAEFAVMLRDMLALSRSQDNKTAKGVDLENTVMRAFLGVITATAYGVRCEAFNHLPGNRWGQLIAMEMDWAKILGPNETPPVDIFPFLRYVPEWITPWWRGWRDRARGVRDRQLAMYNQLRDDTRARAQAGKKKEDCFIGRLAMEHGSGKGEDYSDRELAAISGLMIEGGVDTSAVALLTFVLAMAAYPDAQRRAQEEVDRVFGDGTMPYLTVTGAGTNNLPFITACYLETLRWRPNMTIAIPHALTTTGDDVYDGYLIPKGTPILMNVWAIHHDPDEFADPDVFDPTRFVDDIFGARRPTPSHCNSASNHPASSTSTSTTTTSSTTRTRTRTTSALPEEDTPKSGVNAPPVAPTADSTTEGRGAGAGAGAARRQTYAFGAGRRVCPGQRMAQNGLVLAMARVVWAFEISPPPGVGGDDGNDHPRTAINTDVRTAFKDSLLVAPEHFGVRLKVRGEGARRGEVIEREAVGAEAWLRERFE